MGDRAFLMSPEVGVAGVVERREIDIADAAEVVGKVPLDLANDGHAPFDAGHPHVGPLALIEVEAAEGIAATERKEEAPVGQRHGAAQAEGPARPLEPVPAWHAVKD